MFQLIRYIYLIEVNVFLKNIQNPVETNMINCAQCLLYMAYEHEFKNAANCCFEVYMEDSHSVYVTGFIRRAVVSQGL